MTARVRGKREKRGKPSVTPGPTRKQVGLEVSGLLEALVNPAKRRGASVAKLVPWAVPKLEAARRRAGVSPAALDQGQRNVLAALFLGALEPLVQDVRVGKSRLRKLDVDHAAAILRPVKVTVWALEALRLASELDAAQSRFVDVALSHARRAAQEIEGRASPAWRKLAVPHRGALGAELSAEIQRAFAVSQKSADPIAARVLDVSTRELERARE